ncbi:hypothetical protein [Pseudoalteromonas ruthenica]|uniref:hypothetical protein n=1 Tax=Pseudoalteromonas ruthenica TaxID=151081 RepID=UPI00110A4ACE|nr:hypothetical protein [Pseudoalteromonas ruthenica]TMO87687.1 hypothetical protein CWC12_10435 [Pseudoalteromonas ruthenica]TMP20858.1 hypothetical protein CWC06_19555 [Pseudoalteromonas ruthenica]
MIKLSVSSNYDSFSINVNAASVELQGNYSIKPAKYESIVTDLINAYPDINGRLMTNDVASAGGIATLLRNHGYSVSGLENAPSKPINPNGKVD